MKPDTKVINVLHNGSIGDVWASIPGLKEIKRKTDFKMNMYLLCGQKADYYAGATHPTVNEKGEMVMLNEGVIKMMIPLLEAQGIFEKVGQWKKGIPVHLDLNKIRETNVGMPNGCLSRWYFMCYPEMACDLTQKWLTVPDSNKNLAKGKIIVTRSERYNNPNINFKFLAKFENEVLFAGDNLEHIIFNARYGLNTKRLVVNDFLELAQAIKQCRFHISNQTMSFQFSQGLKKPRILEHCTYAPNVMVMGEDAYDFLAQEGLEYYFSVLYNKYK